MSAYDEEENKDEESTLHAGRVYRPGRRLADQCRQKNRVGYANGTADAGTTLVARIVIKRRPPLSFVVPALGGWQGF